MSPYDLLVLLGCIGIVAIFVLGIFCVHSREDTKMSSEEYLKCYTDGNLVSRLKRMADEYLGPCGASVLAYDANQAKRKNLLEAIRVIELFDKTLNDKDNK